MSTHVESRVANPARRIAIGAALVLLLGASALVRPGAAQVTSAVVHQYRLRVTGPTGQPETVLVTIPRLPGHALNPPGRRWPLLVALHGLGESRKGPERGFLGWNVDYGLPGGFEALFRGRLAPADFGGFVRPARLERINAELTARPFEGLAVVTPYTPSVIQPGMEAERERYEAWLAGALLDQVREAYPGVARTREGTGIDGVSLGGRIALGAGLAHPEAFGSVGGIQPAVRGDAEALAAAVRLETPQHIRLLSTDDDGYLAATRELSEAFRRRAVPHELVVDPGPHDYPFNRGAGRIELIWFHSRVLVQEATAP